MKKFKKISSFFSTCLIISVVLGNINLPVLAYEKDGVNLEQARTKIPLDNSEASISKISSSSKSQEFKNLSADSLKTKKEKTGLEKIQTAKGKNKNYVEGEILVKYKSNRINLQTLSGRASALNFIRSKSLEKKEDLRKNNISVLKIKDSKTVEQKVIELKNDSNVEYAEPNYRRYPTDINTNDTKRTELWGLDNTGQTVNSVAGTNDADIDAPEAWAISEATSSAPVIVAIIDDGVAYNHPDLALNMWNGTSCKDENGNFLGGCNHGYDYEDGDNIPLPTSGSHGTHIAGTIAAAKNNSKGVVGVAPSTKIMAIKYNSTVSNEIKAIDFAIQNGAKIINASFGGADFSQSEYDAINRFKTAGGILIAAAGNGDDYGDPDIGDNHDGQVHLYPSDYDLDNIISVAATDQNDALATFSDYSTTSVDVGAPGTNIYSTVADTNILNETFESVSPPAIPSGWVKTGEWGTFDVGGSVGNVLYGDVSHTPYLNSVNSTIKSSTINLTEATGAVIEFGAKCDTEYFDPYVGYGDYMSLEVSPDGNTFSELYRWNEQSLDNDFDPNNTPVRKQLELNISNNNLTSSFKLRFRWFADASNVPVADYDGCSVNDIIITKYTDGSNEIYDYKNGTSMAAPHVAGLAALIEGYNPNLTYSQVKNIILTSGDSLASLASKTVSGKRINTERALQYANPAKAITAFSFATPAVTGVIDETAHTIAVAVPFGTIVTALIPTISTSTGATVSPASGLAQDFTSPVTYTVTAADGSTQTYVVMVTASPNSAKAITSFSFPEGAGVINENDHTIAVTVPSGSNVTALVPTIATSTGASVSPASGVAQDFTNPVTYTVTAADSSTQTYVVTVTVMPSNIATVTSETYTVNNAGSVITDIPYGTAPSTFLAGLVKGESHQTWDISGLTNPVVSGNTLVVTAQDGSTVKIYTLTVALNSAKAITAFSFPEGEGVIDETNHTIAVTVPFGTVVTALAPTIATSTGASVSPASGAAQDFTSPVTYTVTAADNSAQTYTVTVTTTADPVVTAFSAIVSALTSAGIVNNLDTVTSSNYTNFSGLYFEKRTNVADATTAIGRITFNSALNLSNSETQTFLQNLGTKMDANTAGTIGLDFTGATDSLTLKGTSATIKFYGLDALGFNAGSTADEINSKLVALDDSGNPLDKSTLVSSPGTYLGACEVGGGCYIFTVGVNHFTKYKIDNTAPTNQDTVFSSSTSKKGGATVTIISSGDFTNNIWFAPSGTSSFVAGATKTTAGGTATSILAPATEGTYKLYVIDSVGNISAASTATLTVDNTAPTNQDTVFSSSTSKKGGDPVTVASASETGGAIWFAPAATVTFAVGATMTTAGGSATSINAPANAGDYKLFVIDAAGNISAASTAILTVDNTAPTVTKIGNDSVDVTIAAGATATLTFSEALSAAGKTAVQNALTSGANKDITYLWNSENSILTITGHATDLTTFANDVVANVTDVAGNSSALLLIDSSLAATQTAPVTALDGSGDVTINATTPEVVISHPTQLVDIMISSGTTNPTIDVSSFIDDGVGTLPAITIISANANNTNVAIPASTVVTSADTTWNGIIAAPIATTVTLPETSGQTKTLSTAIEVGFIGAKLSFDKAVRILLPGQAGKRAGYVRTGITFTEITAVCAADNQATGDALATDADCKIDVGSDLAIWTKHFTSFATYTQAATPAPTPTPAPSSGGGGGGGGGGGASTPTPTPTDTSAPTNISVVINNGAATTTSKTVTLTLSASDSSSIQMMISSSTAFSGASWENYSTSKSWQLTGENGIKIVYAKFKDTSNNISSVVSDSINLDFSGVIEAPKVEPQVLGEKITDTFADFIKAQKNLVTKTDKALTQRMAGKILLQVEDRGEAWYVDLVSRNRFYLADGAKAYGALRKFGLGITNKDLAKIPVGIEKRFLDTDTDADGLADKLEEGLGTDKNKKDTDGDGVSDYDEVMKNKTNPLGTGKLVYDNKLLGRLKGRIVLQIESRGEAWYINPADGKRYYMRDGGAAYQIMRFLSLGITNDNIRKINIGD